MQGVRGGAHHQTVMNTILVATDGSTAATAALDAAVTLAKESGSRVAVITVWRALQGDLGLAYPATARLPELLEAERARAEDILEDAVQRVDAAGVEVETRLATGDPADCICRYAHELDARLVAMGTHGYGAVMSLLVGSVSSNVIRHAGRPVLVVSDDAAPADGASRPLSLIRRAS
jgi:nucleotide-binding universal stress UspA family protein